MESADAKQQYNDDRIDELGREVCGRALELLNEQLKMVKREGKCSFTAIEAYAHAVDVGLSAMDPKTDEAD